MVKDNFEKNEGGDNLGADNVAERPFLPDDEVINRALQTPTPRLGLGTTSSLGILPKGERGASRHFNLGHGGSDAFRDALRKIQERLLRGSRPDLPSEEKPKKTD